MTRLQSQTLPAIKQLVLVKQLLGLLQHAFTEVSRNDTLKIVACNKTPCEQA